MGDIAALVAGGLVLFLEVWTIVPAPNLPTLALAVSIPELTAWAIVPCLGAGLLGQFAARGWARNVSVTCAALALGLALLPWCLLPATIARSDAEMRTTFGTTSANESAGAVRARPYDVTTALFGYRSRAAVRARLNLPVLTRDGTHLGLDVYEPAGTGPHPTLVVVYGGAWIFGSRTDSAEICRAFARQGYTAIAVEYRHAPAYRFPTQIDDIRDALNTIAMHAPAWGVDRQRVAIWGRSAGAQLALLAAYGPGPIAFRAVIAYYSPTDLIEGYRIPPQPDPANVDRILRAYIGGPPEDHMASYLAASPVVHVRPGLPPTLLIGGGRDELVRLAFAHELREKLRAHGDRVAALDLPWSNHAFDSIPNGTAGQLARYYTTRFLAQTVLERQTR